MPAIPTHARIEAHVSDEELVALIIFLNATITSHLGSDNSPLTNAAGDNQVTSDRMLSACMTINQAARRTLLERLA